MNTKSSTESELAGADNVMPQVLWTRHFLHAQGHGSDDTIVYQDNTSTILLEKNGKLSSGKCTQHINICHFFVADRISDDKLDAEHCLTDDMIGDFCAKPLQGRKFLRFRKLIMGIARKHRVAKVHSITKQ